MNFCCHCSICCWDSNPWPSEHELSHKSLSCARAWEAFVDLHKRENIVEQLSVYKVGKVLRPKVLLFLIKRLAKRIWFMNQFCSSLKGQQLKIRVRKICEGFRATLYPCPETSKERNDMIAGVKQQLEDLVSANIMST